MPAGLWRYTLPAAARMSDRQVCQRGSVRGTGQQICVQVSTEDLYESEY